ncbi:phasin family protein [Pseudovibrio exalbescens]|uniref:phasin family protein n=1 Tax=Pseudovibrio exalbescens TaxID=197461 RepID=UPI0023651D09|nr:phasin family protein [Pseudovibrio exalbescens]MDD7909299.1 phasin family protein [Pseudovibrio exalbescens]
MFNFDDQFKEAMEMWNSSMGGTPWRVWAEGLEKSTVGPLESVMKAQSSMMKASQQLADKEMDFIRHRMDERFAYMRELCSCPNGAEVAHISTEFWQSAFEDYRDHNAEQLHILTKTMSENSAQASDALTESLSGLKAAEEALTPAKPTPAAKRAPARPKARATAKATSSSEG